MRGRDVAASRHRKSWLLDEAVTDDELHRSALIRAGRVERPLRRRPGGRPVRYEFINAHLQKDCRIEGTSPPPRVSADPAAIEQALVNLLDNTVKYSGQTRDVARSKMRR